jgi:glycosyltransferase involved in cell wall biosynthesis
MTSQSIIAVIPAYNNEATVGAVVRDVRQLGLEVLVVDDGSSDGSAACAETEGATVVRHGRNMGKGHALVTGFRQALDHGGAAVVTLDADGQHAVQDLPRLLEHAGTADLVIGKRRLDLEVMPRTSFIGNSVSTFFISLFCGKQFPDTQSGYRVYSERLLRALPLQGGHFETETELLMRAALLGLEIKWVRVETLYDNGVTPHHTNFHNLFDTLRVIAVVLGSHRFPRRAA